MYIFFKQKYGTENFNTTFLHDISISTLPFQIRIQKIFYYNICTSFAHLLKFLDMSRDFSSRANVKFHTITDPLHRCITKRKNIILKPSQFTYKLAGDIVDLVDDK